MECLKERIRIMDSIISKGERLLPAMFSGRMRVSGWSRRTVSCGGMPARLASAPIAV